MIKEYAIDPRLLSSWERVRYYCEHFSWERGRLISRFPKSWKKMVWDGLQSIQPRDRKRIEEYMARMDARLLEQSRRYDGELAWHQNAESGHSEAAFAAIVTDEQVAGSGVGIRNDDFSDDHPLLVCSNHVEVSRTPRDLAHVLTPVLAKAKQLLLIDPHFDPQPGMFLESPRFRPTKWNLTLAAILLRVPASCAVEYHVLRDTDRASRIPYGDDDARDTASWVNSCSGALPQVLPRGAKLTIHRWQERPQGEHFHARYIITDRYALMVDPGLDASSSTAGDTTKLTRLGETDRRRIMAKFDGGSGVYTLLEKIEVSGTGECFPTRLMASLGP